MQSFMETIIFAIKQWANDKFEQSSNNLNKLLSDCWDSINKKMSKTNPTGSGAFSMNRKANTTVGSYSHAEGYSTTASGRCSHAEGSSTTAAGKHSHAEGTETFAANKAQHVEGEYNIAEKLCSTSTETGKYTISCNGSFYYSATYSIDENTQRIKLNNPSYVTVTSTNWRTKISSKYFCTTNGYTTYIYKAASSSDLNGTYSSKNSTYKFDSSISRIGVKSLTDTRGEYAHIVGNGTADTVRSNAHTLDWEGNAWYAGNVYVNSASGTNMDEGSVRLARVDEIPSIDGLASEEYVLQNLGITIKDISSQVTSSYFNFSEVESGIYWSDKIIANDSGVMAQGLFSVIKMTDTIANVWCVNGGFLWMMKDGVLISTKKVIMDKDSQYALNTTDKTILGAINELAAAIQENNSALSSYILSVYPSSTESDVFIFEINNNGVKQTYPMKLIQFTRKTEDGSLIAVNQIIHQYRFEFRDESVTNATLQNILFDFINADQSKFIFSYDTAQTCMSTAISFAADTIYPGLYINCGHVFIRLHPMASGDADEPV